MGEWVSEISEWHDGGNDNNNNDVVVVVVDDDDVVVVDDDDDDDVVVVVDDDDDDDDVVVDDDGDDGISEGDKGKNVWGWMKEWLDCFSLNWMSVIVCEVLLLWINVHRIMMMIFL